MRWVIHARQQVEIPDGKKEPCRWKAREVPCSTTGGIKVVHETVEVEHLAACARQRECAALWSSNLHTEAKFLWCSLVEEQSTDKG